MDMEKPPPSQLNDQLIPTNSPLPGALELSISKSLSNALSGKLACTHYWALERNLSTISRISRNSGVWVSYYSSPYLNPSTKEDYPSIDELGTGENDSKESGKAEI
eukprot:929887-Amorphochlora_amoeboformis.AAC.1